MNQEASAGASQVPRGTPAEPGAPRASTVLVPLDGSVHATAALPVARALAELEGATLHVVHVAEPVLSPHELLRAAGLAPDELRGLVIDQAVGPPAASIVRLAREGQSALIVMCPLTKATEPPRELGSVAAAVVREAPCPVVLVPPGRGRRPWALRRIAVPQDGTPATAAAIEPAIELARRSGAALDILHVAQPGAPGPAAPGTFTVPQYLDQPQHEWPVWAREFLDRTRALCHCPPSVQTRLFLRAGEPAAEIVRFAAEQQSDLIVLAWHGSLAAERAATLKGVIRDAQCPLFLVQVQSA